jgi:phenylalanyl-tRNA synthetase beta chain
MKVLKSWLSEMVAFELTPQALADGLTNQGVEVERLVDLSQWMSSESFAEVVALESEEDGAASYRVRMNGQDFTLVSRDKAIQPGFLVYVDTHAKAGRIPTLDELGVNGLRVALIKPKTMTPEQASREAVLEMKILSNRGDLLSHIGIARETALLTGGHATYPRVASVKLDKKGVTVPIELKNIELCPRYVGIEFTDVRVAPSPDWMQYRLSALGVKPVNNIVDLSNYVMFEVGQPLHTFDRERIQGGIIVRNARDGEAFTAINHVDYTLSSSHLVIADHAKAVAIGGVMGGVESEIDERTKSVFLESAYFTPENIRTESKRLSLASESSLRFGRGIDPGGSALAALRFALLAEETGSARVVESSLNDVNTLYDVAKPVRTRSRRVSSLLGVRVTEAQFVGTLAKAGFFITPVETVVEGDHAYDVAAPVYRRDIEVEEDVVEEVLRLRGYTSTPDLMPTVPVGQGGFEPNLAFVESVRDVCVRLGLTETRSYAYYAERVCRAIGGDEDADALIVLSNPVSEDQNALRPSLIPGLLTAVATNLTRRPEPLPPLFEIGHTYVKRQPTHFQYATRCDGSRLFESQSLAVVLCEGGTLPSSQTPVLSRVPQAFILKGVARAVLDACGSAEATESDYDSPRYSAAFAMSVGRERTAVIGEIARTVLEAFGIERRVWSLEMSLDAVKAAPKAEPKQYAPSDFPPVYRDIALLVPLTTPAKDALAKIAALAGDDLVSLRVFDEYIDPRLGRHFKTGQPLKNLAFSLTFQRADRTLTNAEIDGDVFGILAGMYAEMGAVLRDYDRVAYGTIFADASLWEKLTALYRDR